MSERYEYRVTWQREGQPRRRVIRQTEKGARTKVDALLWSEREKRKLDDEQDLSFLGGLPDLVGLPTIERRVVGEWETVA